MSNYEFVSAETRRYRSAAKSKLMARLRTFYYRRVTNIWAELHRQNIPYELIQDDEGAVRTLSTLGMQIRLPEFDETDRVFYATAELLDEIEKKLSTAKYNHCWLDAASNAAGVEGWHYYANLNDRRAAK